MIESKEIPLLIKPVYREAEFCKPKKVLSKKFAEKIAREMNSKWAEITSKQVKAIIACFEGVRIDKNFNKEEQISRIVDENDGAIIVDNPTIQFELNSYTFKIRTTIAICYEGTSTKIWTRVLLDEEIANYDNIESLQDIYQKIGEECCKINKDYFSKIIIEAQEKSPEDLGKFIIMTFGVEDEKLGQYLELFDDPNLKLRDLFSTNKGAKKLFQNYYKTLFNKNDILQETDDDFWMTTAPSIVTKDGYLESNNVLFKIKVEDDGLFALGLGYDDSNDGVLAKLSSLDIAKLYAKKI